MFANKYSRDKAGGIKWIAKHLLFGNLPYMRYLHGELIAKEIKSIMCIVMKSKNPEST